MSEEPEEKKRKSSNTAEIDMSEDESESLNQTDSKVLVDRKQALQKLGEIPLLDYSIDIYRKYMKDLKTKWIGQESGRDTFKPKNEHGILKKLIDEKEKRQKLFAKLKDVVQNQGDFTTTDEAYSTDIRFLENLTPKCNDCDTKDVSQILCYCKDCKILICDSCVVEHRMQNQKHEYFYQLQILREYSRADSLRDDKSVIYDMECMIADVVVVLHPCNLRTYDLTGGLRGNHTFQSFIETSSRIACIDDNTIAVTVPLYNVIHIVTITTPTGTADLRISGRTRMTGGITCRMHILFVAFSDAIRSMNLSGQIQRVIEIPNVDILYSVNNDKMLLVYSKKSNKTMSCLDLTNDNVCDFDSFPFYPRDVTTDDAGNIIFLEDGCIWQADSDGKNIKIIISPESQNWYTTITYNKESKVMLTYQYGHGVLKYT